MVMLAETKTTWEDFLANRSPELREQLVLESVPLVHFILRRLGISPEIGAEYEDLVHQGLIGLIEAVDRYDPVFGTQFSSYAATRVRGRVLDFLRRADWMSRSARKRVRAIQQKINDLWGKLQRQPTEAEIADALEVGLDEVQQGLSDANLVFVSMDASYNRDEEECDLHESIMDESKADPTTMLEKADLVAQLEKCIHSLPQREQILLSLYYYDQLTFKEIGQVLGITESRVCQLHSRTIMNLKAVIQND